MGAAETNTGSAVVAAPDVVQPVDMISEKNSVANVDEKPTLQEPAPRSGWLHWHEPGTTAAEKRLIFKLDWFLLSYSCLCYFIRRIVFVSRLHPDMSSPTNYRCTTRTSIRTKQ